MPGTLMCPGHSCVGHERTRILWQSGSAWIHLTKVISAVSLKEVGGASQPARNKGEQICRLARCGKAANKQESIDGESTRFREPRTEV